MTETTATVPAKELYDVVIVGGGAAGLGAALTLARARRSVLIIDSGEARNAPAGHVHNYLGREGTPPDELYAIGREEVVGYGAEIIPGTVTTAHKEDDGGFRVGINGGRSARGRRRLGQRPTPLHRTCASNRRLAATTLARAARARNSNSATAA